MFKLIFPALLVFFSVASLAQSKTTENLHKRYSESLALFFYNNTLRMINQSEDPEFDALISDVEKLKFLVISKEKFAKKDYQKLLSDYKSEAFEEMMTSRHQGKNFDVYMKTGESKGMIVAVNDSSSLYVLDIVGSIPLDKVTKFFTTLDESSEIGQRIKAFATKEDH
jgi:hypothetical protein